MVPLPTWLSIPTAGGSAAINTTGLNMSVLYVPNDLVPAQHLNYFLNGFSNNGNVSETAVSNIVSELLTILTAASISPDGGLTNQVYAALNAIYATLHSPTFTGTVVVPSASGGTSPYQKSQVDTALALKATVNSPVFTGTPQAPTPSGGDNTTKLATTAFVSSATTGLTDANMAANYKYVSSDAGSPSGTITLPTIPIGETGEVWYTAGTSKTIKLPATGTFDCLVLASASGTTVGTMQGSLSTAQSGGTIVTGGGTLTAALYVRYYRTA